MNAERPIIGCTTYRKTVPQKQSIDVYDLIPSYTEAIQAAGGIPILIPLGLEAQDLETLIDRLDGILLPGGGDVEPEIYDGRRDVQVWGIDQERDRTEICMAQIAMTLQKPIFAICRGLQVFNVALGGTLWEDVMSLIPGSLDHDIPDDVPRNHLAHSISTVPDTLLSNHLGKSEVWVNSIHHQAIRDLAAELVVTAIAPDEVIEAAEVPGHPFAVGVQWHPENLIYDEPAMLALFKGLVQAAADHPNGRKTQVTGDQT
jgi:putative glutamine amidotransferase